MQNQQVIEAFLPHAPQEALTHGIGSRGMNRRFEDLDRARFRHTSKARPKLAIIITDEILRTRAIGGGLPKLLRRPSVGGRSCHAYMDHFAGVQLDNEEGEQRAEEEVSDRQEVARPDLLGMGV